MPLSREHEILYQMFIAFGQGLGCIRVSRSTCAKIHDRFLGFLQQDHCKERIGGKEDVWGKADHGAQVLERVRAAGRLAAQQAIGRGHTKISDSDFETAVKLVQSPQDCDWCQPKPITMWNPGT